MSLNTINVEKKSSASLLDGKATAEIIREELKKEVEILMQNHQVRPGLGVILVGDRADSASYVRMKSKVAKQLGIAIADLKLNANVSEEEVLMAVDSMNRDPDIHGILVQLPLPDHMDANKVVARVAPQKDVDGFSAYNVGLLAMKGGQPLARPCTPAGCVELLRRYGVELAGKHAVILGRSNIVGAPLASMLVDCDATVTVCHSKTQQLSNFVAQADVLIAAVGKPLYVQADWLKPGCVVIDVGINAVDDDSTPKGYRLVGDVDFDKAIHVASLITPVPGGVGPMTIAMLMDNVLNLTRNALDLPPRGPLKYIPMATLQQERDDSTSQATLPSSSDK
uniref:Methenyltetrahydrofolate cyclohydrolase n=1 Tax=Aureoumbra lagunensis TaxID=44058 RepID=A0A7S3K3G3_9STRA|mmetsp:Transcript_15603/g.20619  ORF Transcript_15603/g.20619 Transcript_15603/m.20619 type:complete len:338 (+) Transcript_15603:238-1251(+)|eukprot:CAMPEP_0197291230 /NCGR_PEP_ID=MMETSP0890-20130614/11767_1 /TAXON_ID=44058 ORGANISM="Aureoumbra lagunensis, Strain CCMP1510" /NCGR_SAMPLE_ID=MMETSP0890 /ASSEMBLY_ACC=CAM_ASM_000533 /LENGTH=337 /DNA_ID=CAMNT_0042763879 /DNA_START=180 /DNA_END=1193 /DNA_ORIENTATION=+